MTFKKLPVEFIYKKCNIHSLAKESWRVERFQTYKSNRWNVKDCGKATG